MMLSIRSCWEKGVLVDAVASRESLQTAAASLAFVKVVLEVGRDLLPAVAMDAWEEKGVAGLRAAGGGNGGPAGA